MTMPLKIARAEADYGRLDAETASLIKGMLVRGDKQSDIAACFQINAGRVAEINTGQRFTHITPMPADQLPPQGPYPSPYDLWKSKQQLWRSRVALVAASDAIQSALVAVHKAEQQ